MFNLFRNIGFVGRVGPGACESTFGAKGVFCFFSSGPKGVESTEWTFHLPILSVLDFQHKYTIMANYIGHQHTKC